jgi:NAD(P)-dependent dehydrogenase (short-subunit alcohol dehydrogenase family)
MARGTHNYTMKAPLTDAAALVTGASGGIGAATARALERLDIVVNSAGVLYPGPVAEAPQGNGSR